MNFHYFGIRFKQWSGGAGLLANHLKAVKNSKNEPKKQTLN
jgi:hypothetical protein